MVAYREEMLVRIPVAATSLRATLPVARTKLTLPAIKDLVALAAQCAVLCPPSPPTSGVASLPHSKRRSGKHSPLAISFALYAAKGRAFSGSL